jgi:hypothetical protein
MSDESAPLQEKYGPVEEYAGGDIQAYHGIVNKWLLLVYALLCVWALYYLMGPFAGFTPTLGYWGGLGPGLAQDGVEALGRIGAVAFGTILIGVIAFFAWVAVLAFKK